MSEGRKREGSAARLRSAASRAASRLSTAAPAAPDAAAPDAAAAAAAAAAALRLRLATSSASGVEPETDASSDAKRPLRRCGGRRCTAAVKTCRTPCNGGGEGWGGARAAP